ncbi:hypothetical protein [Candidatus Williamhamiltonella defendens]|uniref:Uncharacterized protein n=1 Tax=Candidatus Hamiltonella defensa (Bemisia tabaci) TaxID=672795 RepID=A0A0E4G277_9ENTR|nr:hypothetical protein [Candidatus Hamiltonella defensa]ASX25920.1 hypothetical protein BA171_01920 [Candidatus Hamiltonella defensa (Bemisia tabaci)]CED78168.1 Conserved membrane hypothetical protein [Candidatus Hamiltonella defensa (Bemisia tabaci)]CED79082.1 Conserved membrane hypothetical protein [Candidatus Hamiltonella defensa (Bemisia tabaci)]
MNDELISFFILIILIGLYLFSVFFSFWNSFRANQKRMYWIGCACLISIGTLLMIVSVELNFRNAVEMPLAFGLGAGIVQLGVFFVFLGIVTRIVWRVLISRALKAK